MKSFVLVTSILVCFAASVVNAQAVRNPYFDSDLGYWFTGLYQGQNPGTVTWDPAYDGSARMEVNGAPGTVALITPTCRLVGVGDSIWVDFVVEEAGWYTVSLTIGDHFDPQVQIDTAIEPGPGTHHLVIYANRQYPVGTFLTVGIGVWPGLATIWVKTVDTELGISEDVNPQRTASHISLNAHPNPAIRRIGITYELTRKGHTTLQILDRSGKVIVTLLDKVVAAGRNHVIWNGLSKEGNPVSAGTYFYTLETDNDILTKKVIIVK